MMICVSTCRHCKKYSSKLEFGDGHAHVTPCQACWCGLLWSPTDFALRVVGDIEVCASLRRHGYHKLHWTSLPPASLLPGRAAPHPKPQAGLVRLPGGDKTGTKPIRRCDVTIKPQSPRILRVQSIKCVEVSVSLENTCNDTAQGHSLQEFLSCYCCWCKRQDQAVSQRAVVATKTYLPANFRELRK